ncbi:hypothetical protein BKA70DRAFT_452814 [Coprinopsis sp. MPI-PUGE-AT-0042]|nr:hypothetical protein BKA70DRAFT_452814 [Coprinopsis sp. MPI-PUGE-AT-0042]
MFNPRHQLVRRLLSLSLSLSSVNVLHSDAHELAVDSSLHHSQPVSSPYDGFSIACRCRFELAGNTRLSKHNSCNGPGADDRRLRSPHTADEEFGEGMAGREQLSPTRCFHPLKPTGLQSETTGSSCHSLPLSFHTANINPIAPSLSPFSDRIPSDQCPNEQRRQAGPKNPDPSIDSRSEQDTPRFRFLAPRLLASSSALLLRLCQPPTASSPLPRCVTSLPGGLDNNFEFKSGSACRSGDAARYYCSRRCPYPWRRYANAPAVPSLSQHIVLM